MTELKPPFIFDGDGDIQFYTTLNALASSFEAQDLEDIKNEIAFDAQGFQFRVALDRPLNIDETRKWDFKYPVKIYQLDESSKDPVALHNLLLDWQPKLRNSYPKKKYPDLVGASLEELIRFAQQYNLCRNE